MEALRLPRAPAMAPSMRRYRTVKCDSSLEPSTSHSSAPQQHQRRLWPKWRAEPSRHEPKRSEVVGSEPEQKSRNWVLKMLTWRSLPVGEKMDDEELREGEVVGSEPEQKSRNWVLKMLTWRSLPAGEKMDDEELREGEVIDTVDGCVDCGTEGCNVSVDDEEEFDRETFSRFLQSVSVVEAQLYAKMAYLATMAYHIPKIKPSSLLKFYGLRFVTSSLEKRGITLDVENVIHKEREADDGTVDDKESDGSSKNGYKISPKSAYKVAASAASYLQSHTMDLLPFKSSRMYSGSEENDENASSSPASIMSTSESATVVVADEEMQQEVAKDLNSKSSPCEWFICDDDRTGTRYFSIQGSGSLESWQANLLFEPIQFEGLDVLVHRGIYEAAQKLYEEMLPEIHAHLKAHGSYATFRFTGHSLGGSLSVLINLMLLMRGEVPRSSLHPVVTFGAPCIFYGGDNLLRRLGLPQTHIQSIIMHRDIVPRAFSCNYPNRVAQILQTVNGNFRKHPCLKSQKLLYSPIGKLLILQPEEKLSPNHQLLPSGNGLYLLVHHPLQDSYGTLQAACAAFLNSPHPLEVLSKRAAYSSRGIVRRNHHIHSYLKSLYGVVRKENNLMKKARKVSWRKLWWPSPQNGFYVGFAKGDQSANSTPGGLPLFGIVRLSKETLTKLGKLVTTRHTNMLVVLILPAQSLFIGMLTAIDLHK